MRQLKSNLLKSEAEKQTQGAAQIVGCEKYEKPRYNCGKISYGLDLQKTLPTPFLATGVAYYKRQLQVSNLGIHDEVSNVGHMHIWGEHIASREAYEVFSCLLYHINNCMPSTTKEITLYSDSCGRPSRNIKVVLARFYVLQNSAIDFKFFMP